MTTEKSAPTMTTGRALRIVSARYRTMLSGVVDDVPQGVRGYLLLSEVSHSSYPSQLALASSMGLDRTVMVYLLDELEQAGLVERTPNPADRRQRLIQLTTPGRQLLTRVQARVAEAEAGLLAVLAEPERIQLRELLSRVAAGQVDRQCDGDCG